MLRVDVARTSLADGLTMRGLLTSLPCLRRRACSAGNGRGRRGGPGSIARLRQRVAGHPPERYVRFLVRDGTARHDAAFDQHPNRRGIAPRGGQAILALLAMLPTRRARAGHALSDLLYRRGFERACEALNAWASRGEV
jgi:hypothetical protein